LKYKTKIYTGKRPSGVLIANIVLFDTIKYTKAVAQMFLAPINPGIK